MRIPTSTYPALWASLCTAIQYDHAPTALRLWRALVLSPRADTKGLAYVIANGARPHVTTSHAVSTLSHFRETLYKRLTPSAVLIALEHCAADGSLSRADLVAFEEAILRTTNARGEWK